MKAIVCSLFMLCILLVGAANAVDDWTQVFPSSKPSARFVHAMAYLGDDQVLLFSGWDVTWDDETWVYDLGNNTWTQKSPSSKPSGRSQHAMAYIGDDRVLLFGGGGASGANDETWVYDLSDNTWTQKSPSSKPSLRVQHAMAYIGDDRVLLFGGIWGTYNDETWIYDLGDNTWTQKSPSTKPSARGQHAMACIGGDEVLLFGGLDDFGNSDETWVYDLDANTWTQKSPSTKPSARGRHDMAYIGGDEVLLFGGAPPPYNNETWVYDLSANTWTQDSNTTQPTARYAFGLSETSMDGTSYLVLFGGFDGANDDETWTFGGGDYPLPVALSAFTATSSQGTVTLKWTTQSEWNNRGFHIYRSEELSHFFQRITPELISGAGNSSTQHTYTWVDRSVEIGRTYWYQLESVDFQGETKTYGPVSATLMEVLPKDYRLLQNFPNPFNPKTWINYQLSQSGPVTIRIYNVNGQLIKILVDEEQTSGAYRVSWNGRDLHGSPAASGVFFCQLRSDQSVETIKMILLR